MKDTNLKIIKGDLEHDSIDFNFSKRNNAHKTCSLIRTVVSGFYDLPLEAYNSKSRKRNIIALKQATVFLIKNALPNATLAYIGSEVGGYDHASVIHCLKTIRNLIDTDPFTRNEIKELSKRFDAEADNFSLKIGLDKDYYFIDMNNCTSIKISENKAIVLTNFSDEDISTFVEKNQLYFNESLMVIKPKQHTKTSLFILEKNGDNDDLTN